MVKSKPAIAAIICNYNRCDDILTLLASLQEQDAAPEIFLVDNASTDGSVQAVREAYPQVQIIENGKNLGGTGGFNRGMLAAQAAGPYEYYTLLDSDITLAPDCLSRLVSALQLHPQAGVCGTKIYFAEPSDMIQEIGAIFEEETGALIPRWSRRWEPVLDDAVSEVDYVAACAYMFRGELLEQVGTFDEKFFLYWDDIDWCMRVRETGRTVIVDPAARVWHRGGLYERRSTVYYYYKYRNRLLFWSRWSSAEQWPSMIDAIALEIAQMMLVCKRAGKEPIADTLRDAVLDAAAGVWGEAPAGRIRTLSPSPGAALPEMPGPLAVADWSSSLEEWRYQALFRVTDLLRGWYPDEKISFVTVKRPDPEIATMLKKRKIVVAAVGSVEANTLVLPCAHARFDRDNDPGPEIPPNRCIWMDRHGNVVPGKEPPWSIENPPELYQAFRQLRQGVTGKKE